MLKANVCVICEKVIFSREDIASLINLFGKVILTVTEPNTIPRDALFPREWALYSAWDPELGDEKREYVLCIQFLYPDGTQYGEISKARIPIEFNKRAQMNVQFGGFPVGKPGTCRVVTWVEENEKQVVEPITNKIEVEVNAVQNIAPTSQP
jgi:hypothetical protein